MSSRDEAQKKITDAAQRYRAAIGDYQVIARSPVENENGGQLPPAPQQTPMVTPTPGPQNQNPRSNLLDQIKEKAKKLKQSIWEYFDLVDDPDLSGPTQAAPPDANNANGNAVQTQLSSRELLAAMQAQQIIQNSTQPKSRGPEPLVGTAVQFSSLIFLTFPVRSAFEALVAVSLTAGGFVFGGYMHQESRARRREFRSWQRRNAVVAQEIERLERSIEKEAAPRQLALTLDDDQKTEQQVQPIQQAQQNPSPVKFEQKRKAYEGVLQARYGLGSALAEYVVSYPDDHEYQAITAALGSPVHIRSQEHLTLWTDAAAQMYMFHIERGESFDEPSLGTNVDDAYAIMVTEIVSVQRKLQIEPYSGMDPETLEALNLHPPAVSEDWQSLTIDMK